MISFHCSEMIPYYHFSSQVSFLESMQYYSVTPQNFSTCRPLGLSFMQMYDMCHSCKMRLSMSDRRGSITQWFECPTCNLVSLSSSSALITSWILPKVVSQVQLHGFTSTTRMGLDGFFLSVLYIVERVTQQCLQVHFA